MKNLIKTALSSVVILALPVLSSAASKSIYGSDDRLDYFEASAGAQTLANSVVSFWTSAQVTANAATGKFDLATRTLGASKGLCAGEKFFDQARGAFCSGSLVGDDMVMTAGHCITNDADCADTKLVFGFNIRKAGGTGVTSIAKGEVYGCSRIVKRFLSGEAGSPAPTDATRGMDFALIKLDRKVTGHAPLAVDRAQDLKKGDKIFVIGHPSGIPVKVAGNASVRDASKAAFFVADLDTFGGNSGSPVFSAVTNKIEGILVRGDNDYITSPEGCKVAATFEQTGGRGEDVTKISVLAADIPRLAGEKAADKVVLMDMSGLQRAMAPADASKVSFR